MASGGINIEHLVDTEKGYAVDSQIPELSYWFTFEVGDGGEQLICWGIIPQPRTVTYIDLNNPDRYRIEADEAI